MEGGAEPLFTWATDDLSEQDRKVFPLDRLRSGTRKTPPNWRGFEEKLEQVQFRDLRSPPVSTPRSCTGAGVSVASLPEARINAVEVASADAALAG